MKLIMRADDLGISEGVNYGILRTLQSGTITCVGLMSNMPTAQHGFELIKPFKVCLGLHANICLGKPVSDPKLISSLVNEQGEFYSSKEINQRKEDTISVEECEIELEAQLQRFKEITHQEPDYFEGHAVFSANFMTALANVAKRHDLFLDMPGFAPHWEEETGIYPLGFQKLDENGLYNPKSYMTEHLDNLRKNPCTIGVFHPGFIDYYLLKHSSYTVIRAMECDFLCSEWLQDFLREHRIQLVDFNNYKEVIS